MTLRIFSVSFFCFALLFSLGSLRAADDAIPVGAVSVKQSCKNSVEAKEKALVQAVSISFFRMLKENYKLNKSAIGKLSQNQINACVSDFSVEHEKQSNSYYIAKLSYRFSRKAVEALLFEKNLIQSGEDSYKIKKVSDGRRVIISMSDFMTNSRRLMNVGCTVREFSNNRVVLGTESLATLNELRITRILM